MPLGTEVDLDPGHIVLDWGPAAPGKGHNSPLLFSAYVLYYATVGRLSGCSDFVIFSRYNLSILGDRYK